MSKAAASKLKNRNPVGPLSRDRNLARLDKRTKPGRVLRTAAADLVEHLGGAPTAAEMLLVQSAALKATRLYLLSEKLLSGETLTEQSDGHALAWLNSLRLDLQALGLAKREREISPPSIRDIARRHEKKDEALSAFRGA